MTETDEVRDLLLKEYAEAGQISRQHEQLTRTSASVFVPTFIALAGYVLGSGASTSPTVRIVLSVAGFMASLLAANIVRRHQLYYRSYIRRARAIEAHLKVGDEQVMHLYSEAEAVRSHACTVSSKTAFIAFFLLSALLFAVSCAAFAIARVCGATP